jgi:hypothetical protein
MYVRICRRVVIFLPEMLACPHIFPPAHPHEPITLFFLRDIFYLFIYLFIDTVFSPYFFLFVFCFIPADCVLQ